MPKLYGAHVHIKGLSAMGKQPFEKEYDNWYSLDQQQALELIETAKAIPAPTCTVVTIEPIESEVTLHETGFYKLNTRKTVYLHTLNKTGTLMYGYEVERGKVKMNRHVSFYVNGESGNSALRGKQKVVAFLGPHRGETNHDGADAS